MNEEAAQLSSDNFYCLYYRIASGVQRTRNDAAYELHRISKVS